MDRNIYGDWSDPVYLNSIGFDPSLFHDTDGRKYLVNMINGFKGITVQELAPDTLEPAGERIKVYDGSGIGCCEGPHIYHINGYYYLIVAEGGTGYEHCVTMARSDSVYGPYMTCPDNPLLTSDRNRGLQKCGHADIVRADNDHWYLVHLCAREDRMAGGCILGRETAIQEIVLSDDGYFKPLSDDHYCRDSIEEPAGLKEYSNGDKEDIYDDFKAGEIDVRYSSPRWDYNNFASCAEDGSGLVLRGEESLNSLHHVSLLALRQTEKACIVRTGIYCDISDQRRMAGLAYMYDNLNWYLFCKTADEDGNSILVVLKSDRGEISDISETIRIPNDVPLTLEIETDGRIIKFACEMSGTRLELPPTGDTSILTDEYCRGFTGAHFGMYVHDMLDKTVTALFEYFSISYKYNA